MWKDYEPNKTILSPDKYYEIVDKDGDRMVVKGEFIPRHHKLFTVIKWRVS